MGNEVGVEKIVHMDASGNLKNEPKKTLRHCRKQYKLLQPRRAELLAKEKLFPVKQKTVSSPKKSPVSSNDSSRAEQ